MSVSFIEIGYVDIVRFGGGLVGIVEVGVRVDVCENTSPVVVRVIRVEDQFFEVRGVNSWIRRVKGKKFPGFFNEMEGEDFLKTRWAGPVVRGVDSIVDIGGRV